MTQLTGFDKAYQDVAVIGCKNVPLARALRSLLDRAKQRTVGQREQSRRAFYTHTNASAPKD
ncbi:MAG: hypothetical protein KC736_00075 [Candidatus Moranbacteria bacterium]|nr:hypothetical protein [Candidatus Moranbacteria bacterium]